MATLPVAVFVMACFCSGSSQSVVTNSTIPSTSMAVAHPENATNVSLFCQVYRIGVGPRQTLWRFSRPGDATATILSFNQTDGTGITGSENFFVTGGILHTNLTIRVFTTSFDKANITCGSGNDVAINGTFRLRIIGECSSTNQLVGHHILQFTGGIITSVSSPCSGCGDQTNCTIRKQRVFIQYSAVRGIPNCSHVSMVLQWRSNQHHHQYQPQCVCVPQDYIQSSA